MSQLLTATFETAADLKAAVVALRSHGLTRMDVYSPYPIHGIDPLLGMPRSKLGWFPLLGGITGFCLGMLMSWWMGSVDYRLIVAGMPYFSWVFTFPIAYELTILLAALGTFFGQFIVNRLPRPHHPIFEHPKWAQFTNDKLLLAVESTDPKYDETSLRAALSDLKGHELTVLAGE